MTSQIVRDAVNDGTQAGISSARDNIQGTLQNAVNDGTQAGISSARDNIQGTLQNAVNDGTQAGISSARDNIQGTLQNAVNDGTQAGISSARDNIQGTLQDAVKDGIQAGISGARETIQWTLQAAVKDGIQAGISNAQETIQNTVRDAFVDGTRNADDTAPTLKWFEEFLLHIIKVSIFGGSITFTVIVIPIQDPAQLHGNNIAFRKETVLKFLTTAWLLFCSGLSIASVTKLIVTFARGKINKAFNKEMGISKLAVLFHLLSLLLCAVLLGAFTFLSLGVVAYVGTVGWIACTVTLVTAVIGLCCWVSEAMRMYPRVCSTQRISIC
ncbi:hypothetical protein QL093DRAFT_2518222 [Fusarium oxysporum]|nr:hypothetical protein QL093DRAFT_2518222 [Fusarium oxysporum]